MSLKRYVQTLLQNGNSITLKNMSTKAVIIMNEYNSSSCILLLPETDLSICTKREKGYKMIKYVNATSMFRWKGRLLSVFLALIICMSLISIHAYATEDTDSVYTVSSLEDFNRFSSKVAAGDTFSGKTVKRTADITGVTGTVGTNSKKFGGTFDGNGHTIELKISGTTYQGLFAYNNGTIRNLAVKGSVSGSIWGGCFAGYNNGTIESCVNYASGTFTGSYTGGFAGFNSKSGNIQNCINSGDITTSTSGGFCGGIAGSSSGSVTNCYNTGKIGNSTKSFAIIGAGTGTVTNCYFLSGISSDSKATGKTDEEMKTKDFVKLLGSGYNYKENSYPLLSWQGGTPAGDTHTEHTYGKWISDGEETHSRSCTYEGCNETQSEKHSWNEGEVTKEPTGSEQGTMTFTCKVCGETKEETIEVTSDITVSFYNGDTLYHESKISTGSKVTQPEKSPSKDGYVFLHWSLEPDGKAFDFDSAVLKEDTSLYAVWQDAASADWDYEIINEGKAVKLTKYKGKSSSVVTPEKINGLPVTVLGNNTFNGNSNITYVWIKDSITTVEDGSGLSGSGAFRGCSRLRTVILSENMTRIADYMFYGIASDISQPIQINYQKISEIGDYAFSCCNNIVTLELPNSVKKIGHGAFYQARRLKTLNIPGVTEIEADAFTETIFEETYENSWKEGDFSGIVYAGKVAYIYMGADGNENMPENTRLTVKDGTTGISGFLFTNHYTDSTSCRKNLVSITVPGTVKYIAPEIFNGFSGISEQGFNGIDMYGIPGSSAEKYAAGHDNIRFTKLCEDSSYNWNNADYDWYDKADGKTYTISTADELRAFSDLLNTGESDFSGATVKLTADINLKGLTEQAGYGLPDYEWDLSIESDFAGTFDGNGHTVSGVFMDHSKDKIGFFDELAGTAVIKNLNIKGKISGRDHVGGIAGSCNTGAVIENCTFNGTVSGSSIYGYIGGITGRAMKSTIADCSVSGTVTCTLDEARKESQQGYVGGICGHNYGSTISGCTNNAEVSGNGFGTGGITGYSQLASVTGSVNKGAVSGNENTGGIVGKISASGTAGLHNGCRNEGTVSGITKTGGISGTSVGVIKKDERYQTIADCSNTGKVSSEYHAGGIAGYLHDSAIEKSSNSGSIDAVKYSGGISGYVLGGRVINCFNTGEINASSDYAGGILAYDADAESRLENCYNAGTIGDADHSAPLSSIFDNGKRSDTNCYYLADQNSSDGARTKKCFSDGEVAYLLGEAYGQTIGKDPYPVFIDDNTVYRYTDCDGETNIYSNKKLQDHKTVTVKASAEKYGSITRVCSFCGKPLSKQIIPKISSTGLSYTSCTYSGKVRRPSVKVKDSKGNTLEENKDYTVSYASGRKSVGTYNVSVKFKGNYTGSKALSFRINPAGTRITAVNSHKKAFSVKWKKQTAKMADTRISGYQIRYSRSSGMKKAKIQTVKDCTSSHAKVTRLKSKRTYYVQIRTYKKVSGKNYYSGWSPSMKVHVK